jgi:hypothetical protein
MLAKGWSMTSFTLTRDQATTIVMVMGATYLAYSAYFVSDDTTGIQLIVIGILIMIYLVTAFLSLKGVIHSIRTLKYYQTVVREQAIDSMQDSIKLKLSIMRKLRVLVIMYFTAQLVRHIVTPLLQNNYTYYFAKALPQVTDYAILGTIMMIYRARNWPQFFGLGILEMPGPGNRERGYIAPLIETLVYDRLVNGDADGTSRSGSLDEKMNLVILNPC